MRRYVNGDGPALPEFHAAPPLHIISAPHSRNTPHQQRAALLRMHATAHQYRQAGRAADLKRQLAKISTREIEFYNAAPELRETYVADREREQEHRDRQARLIAPATPPPPAAAQEAGAARNPSQATAKPTAAQTPPAKGLTPLESAVEALVAAHTCGAVIDAAWAAAHRLFHPRP